MKRPLCFLCMIFILISMGCLQVVEVPPPDFFPWEGQTVTVTGRVVAKEVRANAWGETLLLTVMPEKDAAGNPVEKTDGNPLEKSDGNPTGKSDGNPPEKSNENPLEKTAAKSPEKSVENPPESDFPDSDGKVLCYLAVGGIEPRLGSMVQIRGELSCFEQASNPGQFSAADYYQILQTDYRLYDGEILGISPSYSRFREGLYQLRQIFGQTLNRYFSEENASILRTMLLGEKGQADREIKELYQRNGIVHILAISGLHISLIGMGLYRLLRQLGVPVLAAAPAAVAVMYSYGVMTDMGTSALRAVVMFGMKMSAHLLGRTYDLLTALAVAALLILLGQPLYLRHSGFLFSFLAVLAIGLFIPAMNHSLSITFPPKTFPPKTFPKTFPPKRLSRLPDQFRFRQPATKSEPTMNQSAGQRVNPSNRTLIELAARLAPKLLSKLSAMLSAKQLTQLPENTIKAFLAGICVAAVTLPVYLAFYYQFPPYSVLLNLIVIPLMGMVMTAGILTMAIGVILPPAGNITSVIPTLILDFYETLCCLADRLPGSNLILGKPLLWQNVAYAVILTVLILFHRKLFLWLRYLILAAGILLLVLRPPAGLTVTFLDVGQGDCIHIQSPDGKNYLIDGGSTDVSAVGTYRLLPYLKARGVSRLDALLITHPDRDHCSALPELAEAMAVGGIPITTLLLPDIGEENKDEAYRKLEAIAAEAGMALAYISTGQVIQAGELSLRCLHPAAGAAWPDGNAYSTVMLLSYRDFTALFTGDIEKQAEASLTAYLAEHPEIPSLTLLKVAHHGSRYSTETPFLRRLSPAYAVISAGYDNSYGHPHKELLERLEEARTEVYITYNSGAVTVKTDGRKMTIDEFLN